MPKDLNPLFGFRHLATAGTKQNSTAAVQAKLGGPKVGGKVPTRTAVLTAKVGAKGE